MKRDLYFTQPLMNAAGSLGYAPDSVLHAHALDSFGAFITNPISLRPRLPAAQPAVIPFPGGFLLHTGLPNPGFKGVLEKYSTRWNRASLPIIPHLMADAPEETQRMVLALENIEPVMAIQFGFAPMQTEARILAILDACLGELPLIFTLPPEQALTLGPKLIRRGASAISLSISRGALYNAQGSLLHGRMYGRSLFPRSLEMAHSAAKIGLPLIASGGVWSPQDVVELLSAGALAVETDARLWLPKETGVS